MKYFFGIDVGGTTIKYGLFEESGCVLIDKWEIATDKSNGGGYILRNVAEAVSAKLAEHRIDTGSIAGIGVGVPGPVSSEGMVNGCVNLGWGVTDVKSILTDELGKACKMKQQIPVFVGNDANVAALGEYVAGAGKGYNSLVMVTLGTGVGGGIIINGRIIPGADGAAGEIGHMPIAYDETEYCSCGKKGCLEQVASATGIVRVAGRHVSKETINEWTGGSVLTAKHVFDAVAAGDSVAGMVADKVSEYLSTALAHITCVINPEIIVIGGGVSKAGDVLIARLVKYYKEKAFRACKDTMIVPAKLGNDAGIYGAAGMCL